MTYGGSETITGGNQSCSARSENIYIVYANQVLEMNYSCRPDLLFSVLQKRCLQNFRHVLTKNESKAYKKEIGQIHLLPRLVAHDRTKRLQYLVRACSSHYEHFCYLTLFHIIWLSHWHSFNTRWSFFRRTMFWDGPCGSYFVSNDCVIFP